MANNPWFVLRGDLGGDRTVGASPDIILGGPRPDPKFSQQYDSAFNQIGNFSGVNNVYVRARNTGTDLAIGSVAVFATQLGGLAQQAGWIRLHTTDGRESTNISAPAGKVATNGVPLIWDVEGAPPDAAPWCLIAEVTGDDYPRVKVPSSVTGKADFDDWIGQQTRLAYLIVKAPDVVETPAPTFSWEGTVMLGNAADTTLSVSLTCTKCPPGGYLAYRLTQKDTAGKDIGLGKTAILLNTEYAQTSPVAAGFTSKLTVFYTPAADATTQAEFRLKIGTETSDGENGDLGDTTFTLVAQYELGFGQTR